MKKIKYLFLTIIVFIGCTNEEQSAEQSKEQTKETTEKNLSALGFIPSSLKELNQVELGNYSHPSTGTTSIPVIPDFYDLSPYMPEVRSQGKIGSCVSWASGYYLKSYQEKIEKGYSYNNDNSKLMSPSFIFNQVKSNPSDCRKGSTIIDNLNILKNKGICSWETMPYTDNDCNIQPNSGQLQQAKKNKILNYFFMYASHDPYSMNSKDLIRYTKEFISRNIPLIISFPLDKKFHQAKSPNNSYIYRNYSKNERIGYHAVLLVGYDDSRKSFKAINSWGKNWGNNGFFWFDYNLYSKIVIEVWKTTDIISKNQCSDFYISRTGFIPNGTGGGYPTTTFFPHAGLRIKGGTPPYLYKMIDIDNGNIATSWQSSKKFKLPSKGRYTFIVKDANGCETTPLTKVFD